eukprot:scaffold1032_cov54-Phaeocystis_antarctica.AAC.4
MSMNFPGAAGADRAVRHLHERTHSKARRRDHALAREQRGQRIVYRRDKPAQGRSSKFVRYLSAIYSLGLYVLF